MSEYIDTTATVAVAGSKKQEKQAISPRKKTYDRQEYLIAFLFLLPVAIGWLLWFVWPFAQSVYISLFDYSYTKQDQQLFVGLANYLNLLQDPKFIRALKNTLLFVLIVVPVITLFSLLLAYLLNQRFRGRSAFRTIYYLPYTIAPVAVATVFMYLFVKDGFMTKLLANLGFPEVTWYASTKFAMPFIGVLFIWQLVGFYMVYYLSGFQTIATSVYEAAQIDGANSFQTFWRITFPLLRPTTYLVITYAIIQAFQLFDQISAVTGASGGLGSPAGSTNTLLTYFYLNSFRYYKMGYGSAIAVVLFLLILVVSIIQRRFSGNDDLY